LPLQQTAWQLLIRLKNKMYAHDKYKLVNNKLILTYRLVNYVQQY
jgi:hypothetical protein